MKNVLAGVVVVGLLGAMGWGLFKPKYPTPMEFEDSAGEKHSFAEYQRKGLPVLVSVVADTDSFSGRSLALLNTLGEQYPGARLAIVAFHLQVNDNAALQTWATAKGYNFTVVSIGKNPGLGVDLVNTMGMKFAGDVAVINARGRIAKVIETKTLTAAELDEKVRSAVSGVAGPP